VAPSSLLPQSRVDVQMRVLTRKKISNSLPLGQVGSYPSALYRAMLRTGRHQGLQAVQESSRPPSSCQRWTQHWMCRYKLVLRVNQCGCRSFSHMWHRSSLSHRISRLNSRQKMEAMALLAPTPKVLETLRKK
jgi:hypothetical protein